MMTILRFPLSVLAVSIFASGICVLAASAQEDNDHAAGHDKAAMQKSEKKISDALDTLPSEDQKLAKAQRFCPIMEYSRLGSHGTPVKIMLEGKPVFMCCKDCVASAQKDGKATLDTAQKLTKVTETLAKLPKAEQIAIEAQKYCAVQDSKFLGSMGAPVKLEINGESVYLCCAGCAKKAQAEPEATVAKVKELKKAASPEDHDG